MRREFAWIAAVGGATLVLLGLHLWLWDVPGAYMDSINPDYIVVRLLGGTDARTNVPAWVIPGNLIAGRWPLLMQIYHGTLTFHLGLPVYALAGTGLWGIRVANGWFALLVLLSLAFLLRRLGAAWLVAAAGLLVLATDPVFLMSFRSQFYITTMPAALVLAAAALLTGQADWRRALAAGGCAGLAAYGYFIWAFPLVFMAAVVLALPLGWRARAAFVAGAAGGLSLYALGYLLFWAVSPSTAQFADSFMSFVRAQSPGQSSQDFAQRLATVATLSRLALDNGGSWALMFGGGEMAWAQIRLWLLLLLAAGGGAAAVARPATRPATFVLTAAILGFVPLGLVFGNRLWVHHFAPLAALIPAVGAVGLLALWKAGGAWRPVGLFVAALLVLANLAGWHDGMRRLAATGGKGLFSDAISRFAQEMSVQRPAPQVVAADWGIFMPVAMIGGGRVPVWTEFNPNAIRRRLCQGRDVALAFLPARGEDRVARWEVELGWTPPRRTDYAERDGTPNLGVLFWTAADRPPNAC